MKITAEQAMIMFLTLKDSIRMNYGKSFMIPHETRKQLYVAFLRAVDKLI